MRNVQRDQRHHRTEEGVPGQRSAPVAGAFLQCEEHSANGRRECSAHPSSCSAMQCSVMCKSCAIPKVSCNGCRAHPSSYSAVITSCANHMQVHTHTRWAVSNAFIACTSRLIRHAMHANLLFILCLCVCGSLYLCMYACVLPGRRPMSRIWHPLRTCTARNKVSLCTIISKLLKRLKARVKLH